MVIAQNDTDLSCIKFDINVSKCFTKARHFETLISSLIQNKFYGIAIKPFDYRTHVCDVTINLLD